MSAQGHTGNDGDLPATRDQVTELIAAVNHLAETNTWRKVARVALGIGIVALLILSLSNVALYRQVKNTATCRTSFATARADALDDWIRALPAETPSTKAELDRATQISQIKRLAYLKVSDQYTDAVQHNC